MAYLDVKHHQQHHQQHQQHLCPVPPSAGVMHASNLEAQLQKDLAVRTGVASADGIILTITKLADLALALVGRSVHRAVHASSCTCGLCIVQFIPPPV